MEKWAPGQNLMFIFNWSGLCDPEVWSGCSAWEAAPYRHRIDCERAGLKRRHLGTGLAEAAVHEFTKERGTPQT